MERLEGQLITPRVEFILKEEIGVGEGMNSKVYLAIDNILGGEVAVKVLDVAEESNSDVEKKVREFSNFIFEAQALFKNTHPHILPIMYTAISEDKTKVFIVMKYMKNGSLKKRIKEKPLKVKEALNFTKQILRALTFIHNNGYLHLDIKPSNILLHDNGKDVYLADFGQARLMNELKVSNEVKPIYLLYMPPEYFKTNGQTSIVSDLYQTGLTLYRFLNSDYLFYTQVKSLNPKNMETWENIVLNGVFPNRSLYLPHIHYKIRKFINRALSVNPQKRYQSSEEMLRHLTKIENNIKEQFWNPYHFDWDKNSFIWKRTKGEKEEVIEVVKDGSNTYTIKAYRKNKRTGRCRKISKCNGKQYENLQDTFKFLEEVMYNIS